MKKEEAFKLGVAQTKFRKNFRRKQVQKKITSAVLWTLLCAATVITVFFIGFTVSVCRDSGMKDSPGEGQIVITDRLAFLMKEPQRGETVSFWLSDGKNEQIVQRRVIGLPGDAIDIKGGYVYINGHRCLEEYVTGVTESEVTHVDVPQNTYYVLCDDREASPDSRDSMYVVKESVIGSVIYHISIPEKIVNSPAAELFRLANKYLG